MKENSELSGKHIYLVLGFARCGTSTIARSLKALGIDLGDNLTPANKLWNQKGFWEDHDIVYKVNSQVFSALDEPLYSISLIPENLQKDIRLAAVKSSAVELLKNRFVHTQHWGFKDPSSAKILTFWQSIFASNQIHDHYVIALRHPLACAMSYQKLTGTDIEVSLLLWLTHLFAAVENTQDKSRVMVSYELMMQEPVVQLERIKKQLSITTPHDPKEIAVFANEFLDKTLFHRQTQKSLSESLQIFPLCTQIYDFCMKLASDEINFNDEKFKSEWQIIKKQMQAAYPSFCYIDKLLRKNKAIESKVKRLQKSFLWKMLYPIWAIDNARRISKEKKKNAKRLIKAY